MPRRGGLATSIAAPHEYKSDVCPIFAKTCDTMASDIEDKPSPKLEEFQDAKDRPYGNLKLDEHGLPLAPQPSDHKDDPLVSSPVLDSSFLLFEIIYRMISGFERC